MEDAQQMDKAGFDTPQLDEADFARRVIDNQRRYAGEMKRIVEKVSKDVYRCSYYG